MPVGRLLTPEVPLKITGKRCLPTIREANEVQCVFIGVISLQLWPCGPTVDLSLASPNILNVPEALEIYRNVRVQTTSYLSPTCSFCSHKVKLHIQMTFTFV